MQPLRALIVEDSEQDAALLLRELKKAGYDPIHRRVDTAEEMADALDTGAWDIVVSDHFMPTFSSHEALRLLRGKGLDLPFIILSGQMGEDAAVMAMKAGAHDYIIKGNLKRLGPAIERELQDAANRRQRRKAEEDLRAAEQELALSRKVETLKDEFIGMVSHQLRTPLSIIIGALAVAGAEGVTTEQAKELMAAATNGAKSLAAMVENLLELSRHQSNRLNLQMTSTRIEPIIEDVVGKLKDRSAAHRLVVDVPSALPATMVDPIRIEMVLDNLVTNAMKYSPHGGEVRISGRHESDYLVVGVKDQGMGIPAEDQPRLFQSFDRLGVQNRYDIAGVGLGLRVCRILVEAHGGRIWVESTKGKGSTFLFTLPVSTPVSAP